MGKIKQKGKAGAAKAYITRTAAVKKLQCSLADFRRLCILKGIFPREPRHRKKANKGSSAPTSFYYAKDVAYLAHEPVLRKLREHKAFAKKLSRALGRGEWSIAKSLDEQKPVYTLDHVIKERYPTLIDALRDIDDALCLIFLFANLPSNPRIPPSLVESCTRLANEWQLYVMKSQSLRKVFLSIKGIYYQVEVLGQTITWVVPYMFTQTIPTDVDVRVMLTFLELYQTLLGFVFFKLYADMGLVYPPPLDASKDEAAAGVGAYSLQETKSASDQLQTNGSRHNVMDTTGKKISAKDVRSTIKAIQQTSDATMEADNLVSTLEVQPVREDEEDFIPQPSTADNTATDLPTLKNLTQQVSTANNNLFARCTFFLSRETPRHLMEFVIRSFGGRVGWTPSQGGGSPIQENDESITHVIIDRPPQIPLPQGDASQTDNDHKEESEAVRKLRLKRRYIQPQWIIDCINKGKLLLEGPYEQGETLPPHLSPFGEEANAYDPEDGLEQPEAESPEEMDEDDKEDVNVPVVDLQDEETLRIAELQAEAAGIDYNAFEKAVKKQTKKKPSQTASTEINPAGEEMKKMMLSRKKRKLYEKMKYTEQKKAGEREILMKRRDKLKEVKKKASKAV